MTLPHILSMISAVDPQNTRTLDEIDARVWCWLKGYEYEYLEVYGHGGLGSHPELQDVEWHDAELIQYTRSRDVLKGLRPKRWRIRITQETLVGDSFMVKMINRMDIEYKFIGPTEELAELFVVLCAIEYDRNKK